MAAKLYQLSKFGASGLNTDGPWSIDPEYLSDGSNFRVLNEQIKTNNGLAKWSAQPKLKNTGVFTPVGTMSDGMYLFCTATGLYSFDGKTLSQLNAIPVNTPELWSIAINGGIPVVNHPEVGAFYWYPIGHGVPMTPLPYNKEKNWDKQLGKSGMVIRSHKNYMFMLNITEVINDKTEVIQDGYHWSHPSDINSVPPSWDETDKNFLAGIAQLGGNTGNIIDGLSMRDNFVIYSEHGINLLQESGDVFVWNRTPITSTTGPISSSCVVEVMGVHYILAPEDILAFDGNSVQSIAQGKIREYYKAFISPETWQSAYALKVSATKEVWFCVPGNGDQYPTKAFIYNWVESAWSIRELPQQMTYATYGQRSRGQTLWTSLMEMDPVPTYQTYDSPWGSDQYSPFDDTVIGSLADGTLMDVDSQFVGADSVQGPLTFIQRENFPFETVAEFTTIVAAYPKIEGVGDLKITLGSQDYPNAPIRWKPSVIFKPGKQRKIDVRTTGALHAFRVESIGMGQFTMSGIDFEYAPAGRR